MDTIDEIETTERPEPCVPPTLRELEERRPEILLHEAAGILRTIHARIGIFLNQIDNINKR